MLSTKSFKVVLAAGAVTLVAGAASAATINFTDGKKVGDTYQEDGFTFEYVDNGSVSTPNNCEAQDGTKSDCLLLPDKKVVKMSLTAGGLFSLLSFTFDGKDGEADALWVSKTPLGTDQKFSEVLNASKMTPSGLLTLFKDVSEVFFRTANKGSARVDDIVADTAPIPVPAAGFLLIGALGGLAALRRRRRAV